MAAGSNGLTIDNVNPVWSKTPAALIPGSLIEKVPIGVEKILAGFQTQQRRVEHVIVESVGGCRFRFAQITSSAICPPDETAGSGSRSKPIGLS
jgi:dethiobiotin synthetase